MTVAAKAQYEKVKADTASTIGQQQLAQQKQQADDAYRHEQLRQKTLYDAGKLELEQDKINHDHAAKLGQIAADMFKAQTDRHVAHVQAATDLATTQMQADAQAQAPSNDEGGG